MIQSKKLMVISTLLLITGGLSACEKSDGNSQNTVGNNQPSQGISKPAVQTSNNQETYLITASGIGPIKLGATLDEARKSFPTASFERSSDGDGVALVNVRLGKEDLMTLYADEVDSEAPIDWTKKIINIETFSTFCNTENGIHPGSNVLDVEKILGKTKEIEKSEIESREYIEFANQPKTIVFRLDYTGIFEGNAMKTTKFDPKGKIHSIMVFSKN